MKTSAKLLMFPAALLVVVGIGVIAVFGGCRLLDLVRAVFLYSHSPADISSISQTICPDVLGALLSGLALAVPGAICLAAGGLALRSSRKNSAVPAR